MNRTDDAIEQLRCAEINCDNATKTGQAVFIAVVKEQIQEAIKILEQPDEGHEGQVQQLIRGQQTLSANLKQLTQEITRMSTSVLISADSLAALQAADTNLQTTVKAVLTEISTKLGNTPPDDSAAVAAVVADIQGQIASLTAAITPAPPATDAPPAAPTT